MSVDKEVFEEGRKNADRVLNHGTELIEDITKILIDTADYSEGGKKSTYVASDAKTGKKSANDGDPLNQAEKIGTGRIQLTEIKTDKSNVDDDVEYENKYYNKFNKDFSNISRTAVEVTKRTFIPDDIRTESRNIKHSLALLGFGTISKRAAVADFQTKMYHRDSQITENLNNILGPKTKIAGENRTMNRVYPNHPF